MNTNQSDPFRKRNEGFVLHIGDEAEGGVSSMVTLDDAMLVITRKGVHKVRTPDSLDPTRTNPNLTITKQKDLSYGSDSPIIGRTVQQADVLLGKGLHHFKTVDSSVAMSIAFEFAKEIIALQELTDEYIKEESEINSSFKGHLDPDNALSIPSIPKVEQRVQQFILNTDLASKNIMNLAKQFYPDLENDKWNFKLLEKVKNERGDSDQATIFFEGLNLFVHQLRNLRNAISHKKPNDRIIVENYRQLPSGMIVPPTVRYDHDETPLKEVSISEFMQITIENLITGFEMLMAHLCNSSDNNSSSGMVMSVVEIPDEKRSDHEKQVRFRYAILELN